MRQLVRPSLLNASLLIASLIAFSCSSTSNNGGSSSGASSSSGSSGDPTVDGGDTTTSSSSGTPPPPTADVTLTNETMTSGAQSRNYVLAVPVDYDAGKKYPLVLSLHGDGGSGASMQKYFPFDTASKREAIVAYPSGIGSTWDIGTDSSTNTDMAFLRSLVDEVAGKYNVDKTRVLGQGYSKGAFMVNLLACHFSGLFRAIASNAGGQPQDTACPAGPVAAFVFHGDADGTVDPTSGSYDGYFWATVMDGCQDPGTAGGALAGAPTTDTQPAPCKKYDGCAAATPVTWCLFPGVGHVVAPNANAIAWQYFKALP
jgi:polyhydroxybutyrate depolymerase